MLTRALGLLTLAAAIAPVARAEVVRLSRADAPVQAATVYARQALVKRTAAFEAKAAGPLKVAIERLPAGLRDDSVRVRAEAGLTLLGSRVLARPVAESNKVEVARLEAELAKLDLERHSVQDEKDVADASGIGFTIRFPEKRAADVLGLER